MQITMGFLGAINLGPARSVFLGESRHILGLAWPMIGAQLLWLSMVFVDNVMVGRLGPEPLAAMAMASTLFSLTYVFSMGVLSALGAIIAHEFGAGKVDSIAPTVRQGFRVAAAMAGITILIFSQADTLLRWLGQKPELTGTARAYLMALAWGVPAQTGFICLRQFAEATSDTRPSVVVVGIGASLNILLDYMLVFGNWGAPALGVVGAGYATAILSWVMFLVMLGYVGLHSRYRAYGVWKGPFGTDWKQIREILHLGLPLSGGSLSEMAFFASTTLLMGTLGSLPLASHQIALNAAGLTFMVPLGLSFAVGIRLGQLRGAGNHDRVRHAGTTSLLLTVAIQAVPAAVFLCFPEAITALYTKDPRVTPLANALLRVAGVFQIFDGLQVVGIGALRGLRDTRIPFLATLVSFWAVGLPLGWGLTFRTGVGAPGLWYGMVGGLAIASLLHWSRFLYFTERRPSGAAPHSPDPSEDSPTGTHGARAG